MEFTDLNAIYESYMQIYEEKEENEEESCDDEKKSKKKMKESYDHYDIVLEYLLGEGLCESVENAEIMMAHMSESWIDSILDEALVDNGHSDAEKEKMRRERGNGNTAQHLMKRGRKKRPGAKDREPSRFVKPKPRTADY